MSNLNLRGITNSFLDVRLVSLSSWRRPNEITPRDKGWPYVVLQEGYDPQDVKMISDEFVLRRSGKWLSLRHFFKRSVADRRVEFVFGQASEVMQMMKNLPSKVVMLGRATEEQAAEGQIAAEPDEMAAAFQAAKSKDNPKT